MTARPLALACALLLAGSARAATCPEPGSNADILHPERAARRAPDSFQAVFRTSSGDFTVEARRAWSPHGVDRLYNLVRLGFFDDQTFFRVIAGYIAQTGISACPSVNAAWRDAAIADDHPAASDLQSNTTGYLSFAVPFDQSGKPVPDSRTASIFVNLAHNGAGAKRDLDQLGFVPFGRVVKGMDVVLRLYSGYGRGFPECGCKTLEECKGKPCQGPSQDRLSGEGDRYAREFPDLDRVERARLP